MRRTYTYICMSVLFLLSSACTTTSLVESHDPQVIHVVLIWLHDPGNPEHIKQVIDASYQLKEIPGIQEISVGTSTSSEREIVDDSFDVGVYMKFNSAADMEGYLVHTKHKQVVKTVIRPLADKIVVYDITLPLH